MTAIITHEHRAMKIDASAALRTSSGNFFPNALEITAFSPTALPSPKADTSICTGAAKESAVSASSETRDINMESTKLYMELINKLSISGMPVTRSNLLIFCVPILFSFCI